MKIRNSFVSNSSSSSFIVAFPHKPIDAADVQKMVLGDDSLYFSPWDDGKETWPAKQVARTLWRLILAQKKPADIGAIKKALSRGIFDGYRHQEEFSPTGSWKDIDWDAHEKTNEEIAHKLATYFLDVNSGRTVYIFEFEDNEGPYSSALEHGGIFGRMHHIVVNNH